MKTCKHCQGPMPCVSEIPIRDAHRLRLNPDPGRSGDGRSGGYWGRYGAAGLLLKTEGENDSRFLFQWRSPGIMAGARWGIPGGALRLNESPGEGAFREFAEEVGHAPGDAEPIKAFVFRDHGWAYTTILATVPEPFAPGRESEGRVEWLALDEVEGERLHAGLELLMPFLA